MTHTGKNKICNHMKKVAKMLGFNNWECFNGHCLRKWFIMEMVNDPNVNIQDSMQAGCHSFVSAHKGYI